MRELVTRKSPLSTKFLIYTQPIGYVTVFSKNPDDKYEKRTSKPARVSRRNDRFGATKFCVNRVDIYTIYTRLNILFCRKPHPVCLVQRQNRSKLSEPKTLCNKSEYYKTRKSHCITYDIVILWTVVYIAPITVYVCGSAVFQTQLIRLKKALSVPT